MASTRKRKNNPDDEVGDIPAGATTKAGEHDLRPGERPDPVPEGDAAGSPAGGSDGGLAAGFQDDEEEPRIPDPIKGKGSDEDGPYGGPTGGAVGGTPAGKRSSGGHVEHGLAPGGEPHGDSTIGHDPTPGKKKRRT